MLVKRIERDEVGNKKSYWMVVLSGVVTNLVMITITQQEIVFSTIIINENG